MIVIGDIKVRRWFYLDPNTLPIIFSMSGTPPSHKTLQLYVLHQENPYALKPPYHLIQLKLVILSNFKQK